VGGVVIKPSGGCEMDLYYYDFVAMIKDYGFELEVGYEY